MLHRERQGHLPLGITVAQALSAEGGAFVKNRDAPALTAGEAARKPMGLRGLSLGHKALRKPRHQLTGRLGEGRPTAGTFSGLLQGCT